MADDKGKVMMRGTPPLPATITMMICPMMFMMENSSLFSHVGGNRDFRAGWKGGKLNGRGRGCLDDYGENVEEGMVGGMYG